MRNYILILTLFSFSLSCFALTIRADSEIIEFSEQAIDENQILSVTPDKFLRIADGYLEIIALITKEDDEKAAQYEEILTEFLTWRQEKPSRLIVHIEIKDIEELPERYRPQNTPSLMLFIEKKKLTYQGEFGLNKCVSWLKHVTKREIKHLNKEEDLVAFIEEDSSPKLVTYYTSDMREEEKILTSLVETDILLELGIYKVGICFENSSPSNPSIIRPSLVLYRDIPGVSATASLQTELASDSSILEFCNKEVVPTISYLTEDTARLLLLGFVPYHIVLLLDSESNNDVILSEFQKSAEYNRKEESYNDRILHTVYYVDSALESINHLFGLKEGQNGFPQLFILNVSDIEISKYKFQGEQLNYDVIKNFINDFRTQDVKRFYKSEPLSSAGQEGLIEKLVGLNFQSKVIDSGDRYCVLFCHNIEWQECVLAMKILEQVAAKIPIFSLKDSVLKFGYLNTASNEINLNLPDVLPVILLFNRKPPSELHMPYTLEKVISWLNERIPDLNLSLGDKEESKFEDERLSAREKDRYDKVKEVAEEERLNEQEEMRNKLTNGYNDARTKNYGDL